MYTQKETYNGHEVDILYADDNKLLQHKQTKLCYGSVSLEEGRKQEDYDEIDAPKEENTNEQ